MQNSVSNQGSAPLGAGPGWCSTNLRSLGRFPKVCRASALDKGNRGLELSTSHSLDVYSALFLNVPEKPFPCFFARCSQSNGKTRKKKERYFCQPGPIDSLKLNPKLAIRNLWTHPPNSTLRIPRRRTSSPGVWFAARVLDLPAPRPHPRPISACFDGWKWSKLKQTHAVRKYTIASSIHVYTSS